MGKKYSGKFMCPFFPESVDAHPQNMGFRCMRRRRRQWGVVAVTPVPSQKWVFANLVVLTNQRIIVCPLIFLYLCPKKE